ncbi:MAG: DUF2071 domain-containing protein [Chitinophagaceae bacterium]
MKIPVIQGIIERRILINYRITSDVIKEILPPQFRPVLYKDKAIGGICLIRFAQLRPKGLPAFVGFSSENGAHRFAVEWDENGITRQGVYIPRRDSASWFNTMAGGCVFPGKHFHARFDVEEGNGHYKIAFTSSDKTTVAVDATETTVLNNDSIFGHLDNASEFFKNGSLGYSPNGKGYDGLRLSIRDWQVTPLTVHSVHSGFFQNDAVFPKGSVEFDNALLMKAVEHEWYSEQPM